MENDTYVHKKGDFSNEDSYQKKKWVGFVNNLSYLGGGVPLAEVHRKCLKRLIGVALLIEARSREDRRIAFGMFVISLIILILICPLLVFV